MSGFAAIWHQHGTPVDRAALEAMLQAGAYRGPDGRGSWAQGPVALGHLLLSVTPESVGEHQPFVHEALGLAITADARVDNRTELEETLDRHGLRRQGATDAELLLLAYAHWGEACAEHVLGDFAFVVADLPHRRLFVARDFIGFKPLAYAWRDGMFIAASEPRQVAAHPAVATAVNWPFVGDRLCLNWFNTAETLYGGVMRFPAAHTALVDATGVRWRRYWQPDLTREIRYPNSEDYAEHFAQLFREAVRCRLRANGPVAVSLSGGLDSTSVASVAARLVRDGAGACRGLETVSQVYPGRPYDESPFIDAVVASIGVPAHRVTYGAAFERAALPMRAAMFPDVPFAMGHFAQAIASAPVLAARGLRVVLGGVGGDELFIRCPARVSDAIRAGRLREAQRRAAAVSRGYEIPPWRAWLSYGFRPLLPDPLAYMLRHLRRRLRPSADTIVAPWVEPEFAARHGLERRADEYRMRRRVHARTRSVEFLHGLLTQSHNILVGLPAQESMNAALAQETREPFFDRRLVEFSLAIPDHERSPEGLSKQLLRRALRGQLDERVRTRTSKVVFNGLFEELCNRCGARAVDEVLEHPALERAGALTRGAAREVVRRFRQGDRSRMVPTAKILELELWYRNLLNRTGSAA
jgi:asparagine synthase (glutamine-hydrolysing)